MADTVDPYEGDELRQRARKVDPRYSDGPLVRVARARHQAEAEMMEHLLLDQGIPSVAKRSGGFDVPDFLAAGPRDILVPASGAEVARETLGITDSAPAATSDQGTPAWVRTLAVVLAILIVAVVVVFVITAIV